MFELYTNVISRKREAHPDYDELKSLRKALLSSSEEIEILDLGAGSRVNKSNRRKIKTIARNAEKPARFGKLFHRLVRRFAPSTIVELGTSLGLTTLYLSRSGKNARVLTFEGCPETAAVARRNFSQYHAENIKVVLGNIDHTLPENLKSLQTIDFLYVDANHRYEPTVRYFEQCLPFANNESVFIFDDIYWSAEMTAAWEYIKSHPRVSITVDLFWVGLVFFRKEQEKENFTLRF